ncbi:M17 family peptidase N-terminal domain-containing protein [Burkholderia thailandensis]|uniref:M17 family peptidase N-terminal domain-containing protein n=1 Tax=Burkholderia thailandensis TaxID=57975 RepID=UPI003B433A4A
MSGAALDIDEAAKGLVSRVIKAGDIDGKLGKTLFLHEVSGIGASRVLLVGPGQAGCFQPESLQRRGEGRLARAARHEKWSRSPSRSRSCPCPSARPTGACARRFSRCAMRRTSSRR